MELNIVQFQMDVGNAARSQTAMRQRWHSWRKALWCPRHNGCRSGWGRHPLFLRHFADMDSFLAVDVFARSYEALFRRRPRGLGRTFVRLIFMQRFDKLSQIVLTSVALAFSQATRKLCMAQKRLRKELELWLPVAELSRDRRGSACGGFLRNVESLARASGTRRPAADVAQLVLDLISAG